MVFSVREEKELYRKAVDAAWKSIEQRLRAIASAAPGKKLEVVEALYDASPGESIIEELPDGPKSSKPQAVEARVSLRVVYILVD